GDCHSEVNSTVDFRGLNLIEDGSCNAVATGQLTGDPLLVPLQSNGGPTETMALQLGSPAVNVGDNSFLAESAFTPPIDFNGDGDTYDVLDTDQRGTGFPRVVNGLVDLGAFEAPVCE